jgi:hypothetical protein
VICKDSPRHACKFVSVTQKCAVFCRPPANLCTSCIRIANAWRLVHNVLLTVNDAWARTIILYIFASNERALWTQFGVYYYYKERKKCAKFYAAINRSTEGENVKLQHGYKFAIAKLRICANHENRKSSLFKKV